jgi:hypothetical protein
MLWTVNTSVRELQNKVCKSQTSRSCSIWNWGSMNKAKLHCPIRTTWLSYKVRTFNITFRSRSVRFILQVQAILTFGALQQFSCGFPSLSSVLSYKSRGYYLKLGHGPFLTQISNSWSYYLTQQSTVWAELVTPNHKFKAICGPKPST